MLAPSIVPYKVNRKQWSKLSYEVSWGELRMEEYLIFPSSMWCLEGVVINFLGELKPIAAVLVSSSQQPLFLSLLIQIVFFLMYCSCTKINDFNVFSDMDSTFMHMLNKKDSSHSSTSCSGLRRTIAKCF